MGSDQSAPVAPRLWVVKSGLVGFATGAVLLFMVGCAHAGTTTRAAPGDDMTTLVRLDQPVDLRAEIGDARSAPLPPGMARIVIDRFEIDSRDHEAWSLILRAGNLAVGSDQAVAAGGPGGRSADSFAVPAAWREHGLLWRPCDPDADFSAVLRASMYSSHRREHRQQFLLLSGGSVGSIETVRSTVRVTTIRLPQPQTLGTLQVVELRRLGSGFHVQLHEIRPEHVDLTLAPYVVTEDGRGVTIAGMDVRLRVEPGRPYVLMSDQTRADSFGRSLLSVRRGRVETETVLVLTVEVGSSTP